MRYLMVILALTVMGCQEQEPPEILRQDEYGNLTSGRFVTQYSGAQPQENRSKNVLMWQIKEEQDDYYQIIEAQEIMSQILAKADSNYFLQSQASHALSNLRTEFEENNKALLLLYEEAAEYMEFDEELNFTIHNEIP